MMQFTLGIRLRHLGQQLDLIRHVLEHAQDTHVALRKRHLLVHESFALLQLMTAERTISHEGLLIFDPLLKFARDCSEAESRDAREQVVGRLEIESTVEKVEIGRAGDVHRGAELTVRVRL